VTFPLSISSNTPSTTVSPVLLVGGTSLLLSWDNSLPGCKEYPSYTTTKRVSGCSHTPSPISPLTSGSQCIPTITSPPTSGQLTLLSFPSPQTTHRFLHLWCPVTSKQASNPDICTPLHHLHLLCTTHTCTIQPVTFGYHSFRTI